MRAESIFFYRKHKYKIENMHIEYYHVSIRWQYWNRQSGGGEKYSRPETLCYTICP